MLASVVLFEDHTWGHLRPLATSQPTFEQRCGLFNTRERFEIEHADGVLLCRMDLEPLLAEGPWALGIGSLVAAAQAGPVRLWVTGRLAPSIPLVKALLALPTTAPSFAWHDADGPVAARLTGAESAATVRSWQAWQQAPSGDWAGPGFGAGAVTLELAAGQRLVFPAGVDSQAAAALAESLASAAGGQPPALRRIWDIVPRTAAALTGDLRTALAVGSWQRRPFGLFSLADRMHRGPPVRR